MPTKDNKVSSESNMKSYWILNLESPKSCMLKILTVCDTREDAIAYFSKYTHDLVEPVSDSQFKIDVEESDYILWSNKDCSIYLEHVQIKDDGF